MPSPENVDLMDAMATNIRSTLASVADFPVQVEGRLVSAPTPPTIDIYPGDVSRGTEARAFGVDGEFLFTVRARVDTNDVDANQEHLLGFMDEYNELSIVAALDTDDTLGGLASSMDYRDPTGYVLYPYGDRTLLGFQFTAVVIRAES